MPHDQLPRAEGFYAELRAKREISQSPAIVAALSRVAQDGECDVDAPLNEAIDKRMLADTVPLLRCSLAAIVISAEMEAAVLYARRLARAEWQDRQKRAQQLAIDLLEFAHHAEKERDELAQAASLMREAPEMGHDPADIIANEQDADHFAELADQSHKLVGSLIGYASRPLPEVGGGPNTDHQVSRYFLALRDWWHSNAIDPNRRGAKAMRNRIAAALWRDLGRTIPESYSDEEWAKRQFGEV